MEVCVCVCAHSWWMLPVHMLQFSKNSFGIIFLFRQQTDSVLMNLNSKRTHLITAGRTSSQSLRKNSAGKQRETAASRFSTAQLFSSVAALQLHIILWLIAPNSAFISLRKHTRTHTQKWTEGGQSLVKLTEPSHRYSFGCLLSN